MILGYFFFQCQPSLMDYSALLTMLCWPLLSLVYQFSPKSNEEKQKNITLKYVIELEGCQKNGIKIWVEISYLHLEQENKLRCPIWDCSRSSMVYSIKNE